MRMITIDSAKVCEQSYPYYLRGMHLRNISLVALPAAAALVSIGCDPIVDIAGANFPSWLVCAIAGLLLATGARPLFVTTRIEPYLGPLLVVYPCLAVLLACVVWMIFFNRV
jgi:YtcA family